LTYGRSPAVIFIDGLHKVRGMFIGNTEGFSVHACFLVHIDSLLWLLCIDVSLLSFNIIASFEVKFGLVHKYFSHRLGVILARNL